jgi:adenylate cyclase
LENKKKGRDVLFPIGFKLVTIISILVLVSLGTITVLVSLLVSEDVRLTAEDNNFTANNRSAAEAEMTLSSIRSNALVLLETLNAAGASGALARQAAAFFFERNQETALIAIVSPGRPADQLLLNFRFFLSREIDTALAEPYIEGLGEMLERASRGEILLLNAAPVFQSPLLALVFPWQDGGTTRAGVLLFASGGLSETFGTGTNQSYLINSEGDLLIHGDYELVRAGANFSGRSFIRNMRENTEDQMQSLYTDEEGVRYFGAFKKLNVAGAAVVTSIEYDTVFEGIIATTRRNAYLTGATLFLSILFIWFFSKSISGPLRQLAAAARLIEGGQFEIDLAAKSRDEIGFLTLSFRRMSAALGIFGRFTNREIAIRAMRGEIRPGGLPKHATIFFSDIRGFTEKSEKFTLAFGEEASNRIVRWLNEYFTRMVDCVEETGGVVDKFIGDAVMAHWGTAYTAGSPGEDAFGCVRAALLMRCALLEMNRNRAAGDPGDPPIRIGCGINTGIVTAGQLGSEARMEYTVIGDPVNLASRTEALNKPLGTDILITENTWDLAGDRLIVEEMPPVQVKGKEKPVRLFAVVNLREAGAGGGLPPESPAAGLSTLAGLRELLEIPAPDISKVDTGAEEKKYKIGGDQ